MSKSVSISVIKQSVSNPPATQNKNSDCLCTNDCILFCRAGRAFTVNSMGVESQPDFNNDPCFIIVLNNRCMTCPLFFFTDTFYLLVSQFYNKNTIHSPRTTKTHAQDNVGSFPTWGLTMCFFVVDLRVAYGFNQNSCFRYPMVLIIGPGMFFFLYTVIYLFIH